MEVILVMAQSRVSAQSVKHRRYVSSFSRLIVLITVSECHVDATF